MNTRQLLLKFNQGINWNAILAISHRILSGILSYALYYVCIPADYNLWANTHSIIFIALLWIDGGLRKSMPRFAPIFAGQGSTKTFLRYITWFQAISLSLSIPLVVHAAAKLNSMLFITYYIIPQIIVLFLLEGIVSYIRLIYYSFFWNKSFNQTYLLLLLIETIITFAGILYGIQPLIPAILMLKICTTSMLILITAHKIPTIIRDPAYKDIPLYHIKNETTASAFTIHTIAMWGSNAIKSLSERNVMVLLFTYIFGPEQANIFKIANDGAVVVYRTLVKTIGTTDTSLLAHSQIIGEGEVGLQKAFKKVSTKVVGLCIPLLGIITGIYTVVYLNAYDYDAFHIMFILIIGYVLEVAFSSYERVLEINFRYRYLIYAYVPYLILISLPLFFILTPTLTFNLTLSSCTYTLTSITCIGLIALLIIIRSVRLVSALLMVYFARMLYDLEWPVSFRSWASRLALFYCAGILIGLALVHMGRLVGPVISSISSLSIGRVSI